jgi:transposase-like protein
MKIKHSRLASWKMGQLVTEWIHNTPARVTARKIHLNYRTVQLWYDRIRRGIWEQKEEPFFHGPVEVDETYLGKKPKGMKGTGMVGKVPVFGIYDRKTKNVYATIVKVTNVTGLLPPILDHVVEGAIIYSDGLGAYHHLTWLGYDHRIVYHNHIYSLGHGWHSNSIESFWAYLQALLSSRKGLSRKHYFLHVQEAVFRFNNRDPHKLRCTIRKILNS